MTTVTTPAQDAELAGRLRLAVTRLARRMRQEADSGLSPTLLSALASIDCAGPMTLGDLAAREQVAPPTVTKAVGILEEQGYAVRRQDPTDRRVVRVEATEAGRTLLERTRTRRNAWLARRLGELDPAGRESLAAALDALEGLAGLARGRPGPPEPVPVAP